MSTITFANKTSTVDVTPRASAEPRSSKGRLVEAAAAVYDHAAAMMRKAVSQIDEDAPLPIVLVAAPDADLGAFLIGRRLGPFAHTAFVAPAVFVLSRAELAAMLGAQAGQLNREITELETNGPEELWAFAVNGMILDVRRRQAVITVEAP